MLDSGEHAEQFVQQVRREERCVAGRVVLRCDFDDVCADDVQCVTASDDLEALGARESTDFGGSGSGCDRRVEPIDIETDVDGTVAELLVDVDHQRGERPVPALLDLDDAGSLPRDPVEIFGRVPSSAQADLNAAPGVDEAAIDRVPQPASVSDRLAVHGCVDVGVGIDVHHADGAVHTSDRFQDRVRERVIATDRQRDNGCFQEFVVVLGDDPYRRVEIEGVERDVPRVTDDQTVERCGPRCHVVRAQQARLSPDRPWPEAGARPIGRPDVERDADDRDIERQVGSAPSA